MTSPLVAALDVGGTSVKGALFSPSEQVSSVERRSTRGFESQEELVEMILGFSRDLVEAGKEAARPEAVAGVGLAVPGFVDEAEGVALSSMILGWRRVPFVRLIEDRTGLPAGFGHDVRTAAHAEGSIGAASGYRDFLFVSLGTGVGSCMVIGGKPYIGVHGMGGELAHFVVEPQGPPCRCGKFGCLEMVASADAVARRYREIVPGMERPSAREVAEKAAEGEGAARGVWDRAVAALGQAVATYIELMDPGLVVVGGGMAEAGRLLFDPLQETVRGSVSHSKAAPVVPAGLGDLAGLRGAALLAWEKAERTRREDAAVAGSRFPEERRSR